MCSWILTKGYKLIVRSNIRSTIGDQLKATYVDDLNTHKLKGSFENDPIVQIEHLLGIRYKIGMMGMSVERCSTLFEYNNAVITNTQFPLSTLNK